MTKIFLLSLLVVITTSTIAQPVINNFSPEAGPIGTIVTIHGTGFSSTPANNVVYFGAVKAIVNAATTTSLSVTVPSGASFDPVTVTCSGLTAYSLRPFIVTFTNGGAAFSASFYAAKVDYATGNDPRGLSAIDLDNDGKPDLAVTNFSSHTLSIFRNTSSGGNITLGARVDYPTGSEPYGVSTGDIDGDGKLDIVWVNYGSPNIISVLKNSSVPGTISFLPVVDIILGNNNPNTIAVSDFDGDGKGDLVITSTAPADRVSIFRNTTTGGVISFGPEIFYPGIQYPFGFTIGDIDGDNKSDITVLDEQANLFSVFRNTSTMGSISFAARLDFSTQSFPTNSSPSSIASGDLDNDGKLDIVISLENIGVTTVSVFKGTSTPGAISFNFRGSFITGSNPINVSISDLNGDGKLDIVTGNVTANSVTLLENITSPGNLFFDIKVDFPTAVNPRAWVADLNADGKPDIITTNAGSNSISVFKNQITNPAPVHPPVCHSFHPHSGHAGSSVTIDGDHFDSHPGRNHVYFGKAKAVVSTASATSLTVIVPSGASYEPLSITTNELTTSTDEVFSLTFPNANGISATSFGTPSNFSSGSNPIAAAIGDLDGDDKPDLAVANQGSNTVSIFLNTSTGSTSSFATKVDFPTGANPVHIAIGDVDGDGNPDLAIVNAGAHTVSVLRNTGMLGTISFSAKTDFPTGLNPASVAIGDIDNDGKSDIAVTNAIANSVSVLRNTSIVGTFSFAPKIDFATGLNPVSIAIGDLNKDGNLDLAVVNSGANTVSVFRNTGSAGTISFAKLDFGTGINPVSISIGDLNGDGKPDIAVANATDNTISILANATIGGTVSFAPKIDQVTAINPVNVAIGNLDGDGLPDLASANATSGLVSVFRNTGTGGTILFANKIDYSTEINPSSVPIGDLNGDGKPEIIITNAGSNSVSVLNNRMDAALPLQLWSFSGYNDGIKNLLEWTTASEENSDHFELQRSTDGNNYITVMKKSAIGNSSSFNKYDCIDDIGGLNATVYYYKLKMADKDGRFKYSPVIVIRLNDKRFVVDVSPNPFGQQLRINLQMPQKGNVNFTLLNMDGKKIEDQSYFLNQGSHVIEISGLDKIQSAIYLLQVTTSQNRQVIKLIKN